jgi:hypothetical protein
VRDLIRIGAYLGAPIAVLRSGWSSRALMAGGAIFYLSLPVWRAMRSGRPHAALLVPFALALKDIAKGVGCVVGLASLLSRRQGGQI